MNYAPARRHAIDLHRSGALAFGDMTNERERREWIRPDVKHAHTRHLARAIVKRAGTRYTLFLHDERDIEPVCSARSGPAVSHPPVCIVRSSTP